MSDQIPGEKGTDIKRSSVSDREIVDTKLSIPSDWNLTHEDRYVYAFHHNQSPKLVKNQISIYGMELTEARNNSLKATGLVRNTVQQDVQLDATVIVLIGSNNEVIAKTKFDLNRLGNIPSNGARPWTFVFPIEDIVTDINLPLSTWSLAFDLNTKHRLDLDASWEGLISKETKATLQDIVANAPSLKSLEVNFMGLSAKQNDDLDLSVTALIRNGTYKDITLEQLPLGISDTEGEEIARGTFEIPGFTIKANTSKPWTFIFPNSTITSEEINLSKWKLYAIEK